MVRAIRNRRRGIASMERRHRRWGAIRVMGMEGVGMEDSRMGMEEVVRVAGELVGEVRSLIACS